MHRGRLGSSPHPLRPARPSEKRRTHNERDVEKQRGEGKGAVLKLFILLMIIIIGFGSSRVWHGQLLF
jgi:hypothetical protein